MLLPRRTRQNVRQSKKGCFACRAQRKKCDEQKPTCLRCMRSGSRCEGFADYASPRPVVEIQHLPIPCRTPSTHLVTDHAQLRFVELGFNILTQQACQDAFGISVDVWTYFLPQLSLFHPAINAAIASLGATYEAVVLRPLHQSDFEESPATLQYCKALAALRSDVLLQTHGPVPSFLASILLAAAQVMLRHFTNALTHLQGAFTILTDCIHLSAPSPSTPSRCPARDKDSYIVTVGDSRPFYLIAQALDVQTSAYAPPRSPALPTSLFANSDSSLNTLADPFPPTEAQSAVVSLLHTCYSYASLAGKYKYLPRSDIPSHIALDQSRYIARLSQWISRLEPGTSILTEQNSSSTQSAPQNLPQLRLLVLRIQCISAIIYLSTILEHKEEAYDVFHSSFQQIVHGAACLLEAHRRECCLGSPQNRFQLISPVSQPLYLTAIKCRHAIIRRNAIQLLGMTGREGPWHGSVCAKVAQRAMEIEEERPLHKVALQRDSDLRDADIKMPVAEHMRLHGSGMDVSAANLPGPGFVEVRFSRCVDAERMIKRLDVAWDSKENWNIWTEKIFL